MKNYNKFKHILINMVKGQAVINYKLDSGYNQEYKIIKNKKI